MRVLLFLAIVFAQSVHAQALIKKGASDAPDYFPEELMQQEEVRGVTVYETRIDDPLDQAGVGNRIRLARKMVYDSYFNTKGQRSRTIHYREGTNEMRDHLTYSYAPDGQLRKTTYVYPQPSNVIPPAIGEAPSSAAIVHRRETVNYFRPDHRPGYRLITNVNEKEAMLTDSLSFAYDITGRLEFETRHILGMEMENTVVRQFKHGQRSLTIYTLSNDMLLNREISRKDGEGRLVTKEFFYGKYPNPRYREEYSYDPRGRLAGIAYTYDWKHYDKAESIFRRKNVYDDHGKLIEAQFDYADGKRLIKFYDYSYITEAN